MMWGCDENGKEKKGGINRERDGEYNREEGKGSEYSGQIFMSYDV